MKGDNDNFTESRRKQHLKTNLWMDIAKIFSCEEETHQSMR